MHMSQTSNKPIDSQCFVQAYTNEYVHKSEHALSIDQSLKRTGDLIHGIDRD